MNTSFVDALCASILPSRSLAVLSVESRGTDFGAGSSNHSRRAWGAALAIFAALGAMLLPAHAQDISINKTASATSVAPGGNLTYTITVKNEGDRDATAQFYDNLPEGTTFQSAKQTAGTPVELYTPQVGSNGQVYSQNGYFYVAPSQGRRIESPYYLTPVGNQTFFTGSSGNQYGTFVTDGTPSGIRLVSDQSIQARYGSDEALVYGGNIYTQGYDSESQGDALVKVNANGASVIKTFPRVNGYGVNIYTIKATGNGFYFFTYSYNPNFGYEYNLYFSDGTAANTRKVAGPTLYGGNLVNNTGVLGNTFFFGNSNTDTGQSELWKTTGTVASTTKLKELSIQSNFATLGNAVYFMASDSNQSGLWKSDGTTAGTVLVKSGLSGSTLGVAGSTLYFSGYDYNIGQSGLWKSDGTTAGTVLVSNAVSPNGNSYYGSPYISLGGAVYFVGSDIQTGALQLWKTNGTATGTTRVSAIGGADASANLDELTLVGSTLFFRAYTEALGHELYKSDGTSAGTALVKDIYPDSNSSTPSYLTANNGKLLFNASDAGGQHLYISDGTSAGTKPLNVAVSASDQTFTFQIAVKVSDTLPLTSISNTATAYYYSDSNPDNNSSTVTTMVSSETRSLVVTTLADVVNSGDNQTSLREAIIYANDKPGADTITFKSGLTGTIKVAYDENNPSASLFSLNSDITINGDNRITVDGSQLATNSYYGLFQVQNAGTDVVLRNLKVVNCPKNAVILYISDSSNPGSLQVFGCTFKDNAGGIQDYYGLTPLTVENSIFDNSSTAIAAYVTATIKNSTFQNGTNSSYTLLLYGLATVENCRFENNGGSYVAYVSDDSAKTFTGCQFVNNAGTGLGITGNSSLTNCTFSGNGRGILNYGQLSVNGSTFTDNGTENSDFGSAIWSRSGAATVTNSSFSGNKAYSGGAISNDDLLTARNSTFENNQAYSGGAIYSSGSNSSNTSHTVLEQCTFMDNEGNLGGAIYSAGNDRASLSRCTITGNTAQTGSGISTYYYSSTDAQITLSHTIVAGNSGGADLEQYLYTDRSHFQSSGYNLVGALGTGVVLSGTGDLTGVSNSALKLDALKDNGGPTKTVLEVCFE